jgi:hypothetical protein
MITTQVKWKAVKSSIAVGTSILESFTIMLYSIFCFLTLQEYEKDHSWVSKYELMVFLAILITMLIEYIQLVTILVRLIKNGCGKFKKKKRGSDKGKNGELIEGKPRKYWENHSFIRFSK